MSLKKSARLLVALPLTVLGAYGFADAAPTATPTACSLTSDTVKVGQNAAVANIRYTEEIGDSVSAETGQASKLVVTAVKKGADPMTLALTLNSELAAPGDWGLTLTGPKGSCSGAITVSQGTSE